MNVPFRFAIVPNHTQTRNYCLDVLYWTGPTLYAFNCNNGGAQNYKLDSKLSGVHVCSCTPEPLLLHQLSIFTLPGFSHQ